MSDNLHMSDDALRSLKKELLEQDFLYLTNHTLKSEFEIYAKYIRNGVFVRAEDEGFVLKRNPLKYALLREYVTFFVKANRISANDAQSSLDSQLNQLSSYCLKRYGYDYPKVALYLRGLQAKKVRHDATLFLDSTGDHYLHLLERVTARINKTPKSMTASDFPLLWRSWRPTQSLGVKNNWARKLLRFLIKRYELDYARESIRVSLSSMTNAVSRCFPINPPTDIRVVLTSAPCRCDIQMILHELGHAIHHSMMHDYEISTNVRWLDPIVLEAAAIMFEKLANDPEVVMLLDIQESDVDPSIGDFHEIYMQRQYAARALWHLDVLDGSGLQHSFIQNMSSACMADYDDVDSKKFWSMHLDPITFFYAYRLAAITISRIETDYGSFWQSIVNPLAYLSFGNSAIDPLLH
jgi:hypothetical protein